MADSYVQVAPDGTGKQIDAAAVPAAGGATVYRQTVTLGDPVNVNAILTIDPGGLLQNSAQLDRLKALLLAQHTMLLQAQAQFGSGNGFVPIETPSFLAGV